MKQERSVQIRRVILDTDFIPTGFNTPPLAAALAGTTGSVVRIAILEDRAGPPYLSMV